MRGDEMNQLVNSKKVTIVIPVYADWSSLEQCIESLKQYTNSRHTVMFVNDCGPEVEDIEAKIQQKIKGLKNFIYFRNPKNLGFVQTCNRAVLELDTTDNDVLLLNSDTKVTEGYLDELVGVLYASERHGAVCPRSSNATIASVPYKFAFARDERDPDYAYSVYEKIKPLLPRYSVSPVAVGFCMLIRRTLINNFGLFDEIYGLGYSEENDFCLRINKYGYSSVIAHQAFVYHLESKSFTSEKKRLLVEANEAKMIQRYPFYKQVVQRYIDEYIDPVDWFADLAAGLNKNRKVLVDLYHLPLSFNGTTRNALSFLSLLESVRGNSSIEFTILAQKDASRYHSLEKYGFPIVYPGEITEVYDVGYSPSQIFHYDNLKILNKFCLKIIVSDLDIIGVRTNKLLAHEFRLKSIFLDAFKYSDKVVTISEFTKKDTLAYYHPYLDNYADKFITISQGYPGATFDREGVDYGADAYVLPEEVISRGGYVLVIGNDYAHKAIQETIDSLQDTSETIVVLGAAHHYSSRENIYTLPSGGISDGYMKRVIEGSRLMIFPSLYEGFGLPVAEAAFYDKHIILANTEVAREVAGIYSSGLRVDFFDAFSDLPGLISKALESPKGKIKSSTKNLRSIDDYNRDVLKLIEITAKEPVDAAALRERWTYFVQLAEYEGVVHQALRTQVRIKALNTLRKTSPKTYAKARDFYRTHFKK